MIDLLNYKSPDSYIPSFSMQGHELFDRWQHIALMLATRHVRP